MPRISGKDAEGLMAAYAKVHAPKEEVAAEEPIAEAPTEEISEQLSGAQQAQQMAKDRIAAGRNTVTGELKSKPKVRKVTSVMDMEGYDLIDDTVDFLISEGYVQNEKEALAIMSESEFLEGFDEGMKEILNESSENNK